MPSDTESIFDQGFTYSHWVGYDHGHNDAGWWVMVDVLDREGNRTGERFMFNHAVILRTMRKLISGGFEDWGKGGRTAGLCRRLLFKGPDECSHDWDSVTADWVLQAAMYGEERFM